MLVVVLLIGIVTSIAVPRFANFLAHQHVEAAARRIVVDLTLAQRQARFSSTAHKVIFSTAEDYCNVQRFVNDNWEDVPHPDHPSQAYIVTLRDEPYQATILSADFGGNEEIVFDGYGVPDSGGSVVIQSGSYTKTISVDAETGRVNVE